MKGSLVVMKGKLTHGLYILKGSFTSNLMNFTSDIINEVSLQHQKLGHISIVSLQELCKKKLLGSNKIGNLDLCENCVLKKSHRLKFASATHRSEVVIDYVHFDLQRSSLVPNSLSNVHRFITFIDDCFKRVWVYFLKHKDKTFDCFKEWKTLVKNQTNKK